MADNYSDFDDPSAFSDLDEVSTDEIECICLSTSLKKNPYHTMILHLEVTDDKHEKAFLGLTAMANFNCKISPKGNVRVEKQSKFARLYRLQFESNPVERYRKAQQLLKHFVGKVFLCRLKKKNTGWSAETVVPLEPKYSKDWTETGAMIESGKKEKHHNKSEGGKVVQNFKIKSGESEEDFLDRVFNQSL
ncbi:hypothetical protein J3998_09875 [Thiomicrorhabdus sp. 6S2-11]|uniref:DUF669 domain-containing protein n=1 Tax=Thiomicrorhabdus marina TaxID=2818442 RepID=A0ABS3Q6C8_9GAMM|nr:hypothetical protein [Thiomicrorhabdus marina]MBO1927884.1 hypothetical protein [Thiomicrorhabdus marina]